MPIYRPWKACPVASHSITLDRNALDNDSVEWLFPAQQPIEMGDKDSGVYQLNGAAYDPNNDVSLLHY